MQARFLGRERREDLLNICQQARLVRLNDQQIITTRFNHLPTQRLLAVQRIAG